MPPIALLHPRYWSIWLLMGVLWLLVRLPYPYLMAMGRGLGKVLLRFAHARRSYAQRNIALCFPTHSSEQQAEYVQQHFAHLGMSLMEMMVVWLGRSRDIIDRMEVVGQAYLDAAQQQTTGSIICVFHTVHMEAMGLLAGHLAPIHPVYRPHENALIEWFMHRHRSRHTAGAISNRSVRQIIAELKAGKMVWLSPDQRNRGDGILVPFFGHDTLTHPSIVRIARITQAQVIPLFCRMMPNGHYRITCLPPLEDFAQDDDAQALTRLMRLLEQDIALAPEQYLWVHNRFNLSKH